MSSRNENDSSNFATITSIDQKMQQDMLMYTAAALALAKHRPNSEKGRSQRKNVEVEEEPKLRRNRTAFNEKQLDKLERCFQLCQYPTVAVRDKLAKETGLPEAKIQVWYKNRRAKHRKHLRNLPSDENNSDEVKVQASYEPSFSAMPWNAQFLGSMYNQFLGCTNDFQDQKPSVVKM